MTTPDADAAFNRAIARLRRIRTRLLIVGTPLLVLTPLIVALSVAAGASWMKWFWLVPIGVLAIGLGLWIGAEVAERRRWQKQVLEIARLDLEASARIIGEGVQDS